MLSSRDVTVEILSAGDGAMLVCCISHAITFVIPNNVVHLTNKQASLTRPKETPSLFTTPVPSRTAGYSILPETEGKCLNSS